MIKNFFRFLFDEELGKPYQFLLGTLIVICLNMSGLTLLLDAVVAMQKEARFTSVGVSTETEDLARVYALIIDRESFLSRFKERTPLDRCELSVLLEQTSHPSHQMLLIDLDLSPKNSASEIEIACQNQLETTLLNLPVTIVLMKPVGNDKQDWIKLMKAHGFRFFDPLLSEPFGLLVAQKVGPDSPIQIVREVFGKNTVTLSPQKLDYASMFRGEVIARDLQDQEWPLLDQAKLVLIGGDWDLADTHVTPINDRLPGVLVHAISMNTALNGNIKKQLPGWLLNLMGYLLVLPLTAAIIHYAQVSQLEKLEFRKSGKMSANSIWSFLFYFSSALLLVYISFAAFSIIWVNSLLASELLICVSGHFLGFVFLRITSVRGVATFKSSQNFRLRDVWQYVINLWRANCCVLRQGSNIEKIGLITWLVKWLVPLVIIFVYRDWL